MNAPILLFTYKRIDTLKRTVDALLKNRLANLSNLYIFSDGYKSDNDKDAVRTVRDYLKTISGFKQITIIESPTNKGLASSIISGVSLILEKYDRVIVLEDDLITTPNFLTFMNSSLKFYENIDKVFSISGYSFNLGGFFDENDAYFLNRGWSWGWATWKNRWDMVDWEVKDYLEFKMNTKSRKEFSKGGSDLNKMLDKQMNGYLDSWAIRWFYHQYKIGGITLYPVLSKVFNNGFDENATHTTGSVNRYLPLVDDGLMYTFSFPDIISESKVYQQKFLRKMGYLSRILSKIQNLFVKIF